MRRPALTGGTASCHPLIETRRAHPAGIERVPPVPAVAPPAVVLAWRPAAERAADTRAGIVGLVFIADVGFKNRISDRRRLRRQYYF